MSLFSNVMNAASTSSAFVAPKPLATSGAKKVYDLEYYLKGGESKHNGTLTGT